MTKPWYNEERVRQSGSVVLTEWKAKREAERQQRPLTRAFAGARIDRLTAAWRATSISINQELRGDLDKLRQRSRELANNNDYAAKFIKMVEANIVGPNGFKFQSRVQDPSGLPDAGARKAIQSAFARWCRKGVCEVSGKLSFKDVCDLVASGTGRDGEYLVREIYGPAAGNEFGYALQVLDVDRIDTTMNIAATANRNAIVMGVEINSYRRPVAYWLYEAHPNEAPVASRKHIRIPANEILHDFIMQRPEQVRGIPWMHASMLSMHHLGEFEGSAMIAARKGADTLGFFVSPDGQPPSDIDPETDEPIEVSVPGQFDTLPEGYDFRNFDSKYPNEVFEPFTKAILRRISSGLNVSYNTLGNDLEGVNFSSIRSAVLEERDQWMALQEWQIQSFQTPVFEHWLRIALLSGAVTQDNGSALPASKLDKFLAHGWQGRRWPWVDPKKDLETAVMAVENRLNSPQNIAASMGLDVEDVLDDIARFEQMAQQKGVALAARAVSPASAAPEPEDE